LHGVIYFLRIADTRAVSNRSLRLFKQLCGDPTLRNVVIVAAWDEGDVPTEVEQREEARRTLQHLFKPALDQQAQLLLHDNTQSSAHEVLRTVFRNRPTSLLIQRELADDRKGLWDTQAGMELRKQMEGLVNDLRKNVQRDDSKELQEKLDKLTADLVLIQNSLQEVRREKVSIVTIRLSCWVERTAD
jgi:hypothetical protein